MVVDKLVADKLVVGKLAVDWLVVDKLAVGDLAVGELDIEGKHSALRDIEERAHWDSLWLLGEIAVDFAVDFEAEAECLICLRQRGG